MGKLKYEKPVVKSLDTMDVAQGSCFSGGGELNLGECQPGSIAVEPCTNGGKPYPRDVCLPTGGFAGASCFSGSDAG